MEFLEKLQRVCGQITQGTTVQPILSSPGPTRLTVGNWSLLSQREGEVNIHNADGNKVKEKTISLHVINKFLYSAIHHSA